MPHTPKPADPLFEEALIYLGARHHSIEIDTVDGRWVYTLDGEVVTEGQIIARAFALGLAGHPVVQ